MTATEKMKKIIETKGLTEAQLAEAIGVSKGAMHNWMKGVGKPTGTPEAKLQKYAPDNGIFFYQKPLRPGTLLPALLF